MAEHLSASKECSHNTIPIHILMKNSNNASKAKIKTVRDKKDSKKVIKLIFLLFNIHF